MSQVTKQSKIISIGNHACIRQQKQGIALKDYEVHSITSKNPAYPEYFKSVSLYASQDQLRQTLKLFPSDAIFHVHTEPYWYVQLIRETYPDATIVLDLHDSMYFRGSDPSKHSTEERCAIEMADALIYVSSHCQEVIESYIPSAITKPSIVFPSYVNERFYKLTCWSREGGIVYEGRADKRDFVHHMDYCKFHDLAKVLKDEGIQFHIMSGNTDPDTMEEYSDAIHEGCLPYEKMMKHLGHFDWGLCGNMARYEEWDVAMPNKLFEYMAGGLPVIAMNAKAVGEFVEEHGVGISVSSVAELKERWDEREQCQANVFKKRWQWSMERNIHVLTELYEFLRPEGSIKGRGLQDQPETQDCEQDGNRFSLIGQQSPGSLLRERVSDTENVPSNGKHHRT